MIWGKAWGWWLGAGCEGPRGQAAVLRYGLWGQGKLVHPEDLLIVHDEELDKLGLVPKVQEAGTRVGARCPRTIRWPQQCRPKHNAQVVGRHLVFLELCSHPGVRRRVRAQRAQSLVVEKDVKVRLAENCPSHGSVVLVTI